MKKVYLIVPVFFMFILCGCGPENLQRSNPLDPQYNAGGETGTIEGTCFVETQPAVGANISTTPTTKNVQTDANGRYTLPGLSSGPYSVKAEVPWYTPYNSSTTQVVSDSITKVDIVIPSTNHNYQPPCIPEGFETYTPSLAPPTPWSISVSGGSVYVDGSCSSNGTKSCRLYSGSLGTYAKLQLFGLNASKGVRVTAKMRTDNLTGDIKIGVSDTGSKTTEFGFNNSTSVKYLLPSGAVATPSLAATLTANTWYTFFFELDYETKTARFELWDRYKTTCHYNSNTVYFTDTFSTIDKFYISNTNSSSVANIDEIEVIKK
ncbi:MAG: carboxypeptidase-like regulatory domain-containing protein [Candidatus Firestonebacteria bacterium]